MGNGGAAATGRKQLAVTGTDPEAQPLSMTVSSVLLDGAGPIDATVNGQPGNGSSTTPVGRVQLTGATGSVTAQVRLVASCALARPEPYDLVVTANDGACSQNFSAEVFRITVVEPPAALRIEGDSVVCAESLVRYTVGAAPGSYQWTVEGGQIQGAAVGSTVLVQWPSGGRGTVSVRGVLGPDCLTAAARCASSRAWS